MLPILTPEELFYAFLFEAGAFALLVYYARKGDRKLSKLESEVAEIPSLRSELSATRKDLLAAKAGRERLNESINRLISQPDTLLECLSTAKTDGERAECIKKLMGAGTND
jgi:hypothetical protein